VVCSGFEDFQTKAQARIARKSVGHLRSSSRQGRNRVAAGGPFKDWMILTGSAPYVTCGGGRGSRPLSRTASRREMRGTNLRAHRLAIDFPSEVLPTGPGGPTSRECGPLSSPHRWNGEVLEDGSLASSGRSHVIVVWDLLRELVDVRAWFPFVYRQGQPEDQSIVVADGRSPRRSSAHHSWRLAGQLLLGPLGRRPPSTYSWS